MFVLVLRFTHVGKYECRGYDLDNWGVEIVDKIRSRPYGEAGKQVTRQKVK